MASTLQANNTVEIPLSKTKLALLLIGSLAFVAAGLWFVTHPDIRLFGNRPYPVFTYTIGVLAIALFGFCAYCLFKKMFDTRPGLIVSDEGITDNASGFTFGLIPWADIEDINAMEMGKQKLIMVFVSNPEDYIGTQTNGIMKKMAAMNYRSYGTPISITANTLQYDFEELYRLLRGRMESRA
ncbi:STM3941 family protein [Mucilaginibacter pedocola]|uniref:Uncharacterized protein n=1 Tax=Mucilaginibacter pedocola TaxID=1792845 RepID=A0A1S9PAZ5_9SPHI|nr:STM3941 family protein [Mucilaginibacter pedocola]OOQ58153.1 hypothetical protein BC343_10910 [Mucilaginibacter pedocola]